LVALPLAIAGVFILFKPSPVGAWTVSDSQDWIEFTDQKNEDLFAPSHDGLWLRHRGKDTAGEGMWLRVPGDRHSFDMISHVSGPMWVKDGRVTLNARIGEWKHGFSSEKVTTLTRR
jgi:hypothetical protein